MFLKDGGVETDGSVGRREVYGSRAAAGSLEPDFDAPEAVGGPHELVGPEMFLSLLHYTRLREVEGSSRGQRNCEDERNLRLGLPLAGRLGFPSRL